MPLLEACSRMRRSSADDVHNRTTVEHTKIYDQLAELPGVVRCETDGDVDICSNIHIHNITGNYNKRERYQCFLSKDSDEAGQLESSLVLYWYWPTLLWSQTVRVGCACYLVVFVWD